MTSRTASPGPASDRPARSEPARRQGFTLVELMISMLIIVILMGLLIPALQVVRAAAASAKCLANLKAIDQVAFMWGDDHDDYLMPMMWSTNREYIEANGLDIKNSVRTWGITDAAINCPTLKGDPIVDNGSATYGINMKLGVAGPGPGTDGESNPWGFPWGMFNCYWRLAANTTMANIRKPTEKVYFIDSTSYVAWYSSPYGDPPSVRRPHHGKANIAWMDGHCSAEPADFATVSITGVYFDKP
jgi:prepilin-type N-terminal cleavage/methylation domain-containing protein/prepilin-type processing-associated H-X9-DG protein